MFFERLILKIVLIIMLNFCVLRDDNSFFDKMLILIFNFFKILRKILDVKVIFLLNKNIFIFG